MHNYEALKETHGSRVSQTVDSPIMVFDYFELSDVFLSVGVVMFFGVILYAWVAMFSALFFTVVVLPLVKKKYPKGILLHWPYKNLKMSLPGLINPGSRQKFSN